MPKSLTDLERFLTGRGYACRRVRETMLVAELPTAAYTNGAGGRSITVHLSLDPDGGMLSIDTPGAFVLGEAEHRDATLACLNAAAAGTAFVKPHLDPSAGDVRFRVDCPLGKEGLDDESLLRMLSLIPQTADRWYAPIKIAVEQGYFKLGEEPPPGEDARLRSLAHRAGGINRIAALVRISRRHSGRDANPSPNLGALA
jgi:hypothetical protein